MGRRGPRNLCIILLIPLKGSKCLSQSGFTARTDLHVVVSPTRCLAARMPGSTLQVRTIGGESVAVVNVCSDTTLDELREQVKTACCFESDAFKLLHGSQALSGSQSAQDQGLVDGTFLTLVRQDVWLQFNGMINGLGYQEGVVPRHLYPKGFIHPWHEEWLYDGDGYMGYYLQATKGPISCGFDEEELCIGGMVDSYNESAHTKCQGMTKEEAAAKYIEVVTKLLNDPEFVCQECAAKDRPFCNGRCDCGDSGAGDAAPNFDDEESDAHDEEHDDEGDSTLRSEDSLRRAAKTIRLRVGNSHSLVEDPQPSKDGGHMNQHCWTMFVELLRDPPHQTRRIQNFVATVRFKLAPYFTAWPESDTRSVRVGKDPQVQSAPFEITRIGWGSFPVTVIITWHPRLRMERMEVQHELCFDDNGSSSVHVVELSDAGSQALVPKSGASASKAGQSSAGDSSKLTKRSGP